MTPDPDRRSRPSPPGIDIRISGPRAVALETTLLLHGVPTDQALSLHDRLTRDVTATGAQPALIGVLAGRATVGITRDELAHLLALPSVLKANTSNLGLAIHRRLDAATTVSTTMEIAHAAGIRAFATGGIGGVHRGYAVLPDISADLAALARFPVAVVSSGVKSILDVHATREALETLGIPVVGYGTDRVPAFYLRDGGCRTDARFDDPADLAAFCRDELARTGRGVLICNPISPADELPAADWDRWLAEAERRVADRTAQAPGGLVSRDATPALLAELHTLSGGATLRANIALVRSNAALAGRLASAGLA